MSTFTQTTRRELSLLKLAQELGNVSKACRIMGYHRDTFYEIRHSRSVASKLCSRKNAGREDPTPIEFLRKSRRRFSITRSNSRRMALPHNDCRRCAVLFPQT